MVQNLAVSPSPKVLPHPAAARVDPAAEAAYLRSLIERQPTCLMRVTVDGALLAVSDAALNLLAGKDLAQVLGTCLPDRLVGEPPDFWRDFAARVAKNGSASVECKINDLSDTARIVQLQGVALPDHPDGIDSMLVAARDVTSTRRLEATLSEQEGQRQLIAELSARLTEAQASYQRLETMASQREAQLQRLIHEHAEERRALQESLEQAHRLQAQQQDRQNQQALDALRAELEQESTERETLHKMLEQTVAEREAFEAALREREAKRQKLVADHATARVRAEQALVDAQGQIEQLTRALGAVIDAATTARQVLKPETSKTDGQS
jgi:hypothetical protein